MNNLSALSDTMDCHRNQIVVSLECFFQVWCTALTARCCNPPTSCGAHHL